MGTQAKDRDLTTEIADLFPRQGEWTERHYFALPDTNHVMELSNGRLIMPPHPTFQHQRILQQIYRALADFAETERLGTVMVAPLPVHLWPDKVREPDVFFISREHEDRIGEQYCGVPDLVVEVLSPGTRDADRGEKYLEYAQAGVQEYWIADPDNQIVEVYRRKGQTFEPHEKFASGDVLTSPLLAGFETAVDDLFPAD